MRNVKLAFRTLLKTPFVTAIAVISLALGIGANAAIFSMFNQLLLRPLPVQRPGELVNFKSPGPKQGSTSCNTAGDCDEIFSYAMYRDLERGQKAFTAIAAHRAFGANVAFRGQTMSSTGMLVSGSYFPVLGLQPALGRLFTVADDQTVGAHAVAILSYAYWETRLGSDPGVLNETIVINGHPMTVIGVAPKGFDGTTLGEMPRVFVPLSMRGYMQPGFTGFENRRQYWAYVFGRLKPGVSLEQAQTQINAVYRPIINDVEAKLQEGLSDRTMQRFKTKQITLAPGARGQSSVHKEARTPLSMLFAITGIVLLIACANIANLLLARAAGRSMEMAIRLSLGASRAQVLRQLLTESVLLALLGGAVSLLIAKWTLSGVVSILPNDAAEAMHFSLDGGVIAFAALLSIGTGVLFGLYPALHSTRSDLVTTIRANAGQLTGVRAATRFRNSLVTVQIALSMALLISAGLFVRSLMNVSRVDLGIRTENVITFGISPELNGYKSEASRALFQRIEDELAAVPGVSGVTAGLVAIIAGNNWGNNVEVEGFKSGPDVDTNARYNEVGTNYLHVLGIPLLAGREFTAADGVGAPKVAIVNESFAKKFGLGKGAVGKRMSMGGKDLDVEIVGLMKDAKYSQVKDQVPPLFFRPYRQDDALGQITFYVRTSLSAEQLLRVIPAVIKKLDPNLPVENLKTLPQQVKENVFLDRMISTLSAAFAALATLLAAVGLYGVLAFTVAQRTREIGVRMALGADSARVRRMVLRQVGWMTVIGGAAGIAGALALGKAASSLLFGLSGNDPLVVISSATMLVLVAFGAGYIPALRASRVDPMQALRYE
jgi:putative ABC transport system permease protein